MSKNNMAQPSTSKQSESLPPEPIPLELKVPAPLPHLPNPTNFPSWRKLPGAPILTVKKNRHNNVSLEWIVPKSSRISVAAIKCYQIFIYILTPDKQPSSSDWEHVDTIEALPLPMSHRLAEFDHLRVYYCAIRACDVYCRFGPFSLPIMVNLGEELKI